MARIQVFEGGGIMPDAPNVTPFRAPDFGPGIGPGVEKLGESVGEAAQKIDEIQDIHARIEANRLTVAYNDLATNISERVRSSLGEGAPHAADQGIADLQKGADDILSKASPRARAMLQTEFAKRTSDYRGQWWEHGFEQSKQAFDTSAQAANDHDLDAGLKSSTDDAAKPYLDSIKARNHQRATFFGLGSDWEKAENAKYVSSFYKGRAVTLGANSAYDAIHYAMQHRDDLTGDDFNAIVRSYSDEAYHERAASIYYGTPLGSDPALSRDTPVNDNGQPVPTARADPKMVFNGLIIPNEGSKLIIDNNGHPVKYGVNQKENPDVDVANLTRSGAEKVFTDRYWNAIGGDDLPPALAVAAADTAYVAGVGKAKQFLRESGNDVEKFMELRNNFLAQLHASNPQKYPDYSSRNERVEKYAAAVGGDGTPLSFAGRVGPKTPMEPIIQEIMGRKDMPLRLKTALIDLAREDRNAQREDLRIKEDDARDSLITASTKLGTNFTSIKQLPQAALADASPETVASLTDLARTNRYKKNDEALRPEITFTMVTNPQRFASAEFITELMRKGASPSLISEVQTEQQTIIKKAMNAKPDPISDGTLWSVAKPAFQAAGIAITAGPQDKEGKKRAAQQQVQAVNFLQREATEWETDNPGKRATPEIMRQWVGAALLKTRSGTPLFQANDADVYNSLSDGVRNTLIRDLRRGGVNSQGDELISDVANLYRKLRAIYGTGPIALGTRDGSVQAQPLRGVESRTDELSDQ
jgi:hypothetical protein